MYAERAFRQPLVAFLVGLGMLAAGVTSAAGLALAFAGDYLGVFLGTNTAVLALRRDTVRGHPAGRTPAERRRGRPARLTGSGPWRPLS